MKVLQASWYLGRGMCLLVLNINSSHPSVPLPTMNNGGSTQLCHHSELLIHNYKLALVHSVGHSPLQGAGTFACLRLTHMHMLTHKGMKMCMCDCAHKVYV